MNCIFFFNYFISCRKPIKLQQLDGDIRLVRTRWMNVRCDVSGVRAVKICVSEVRVNSFIEYRQRHIASAPRKPWQVVYIYTSIAYPANKFICTFGITLKKTFMLLQWSSSRKIWVGFLLRYVCVRALLPALFRRCPLWSLHLTQRTHIAWLFMFCLFKDWFWLSCWVPFIIHFIDRHRIRQLVSM